MLAGAIIAAAPAVASATVTPSGNLELCKTFAAVPSGQQSYQGTFSYTIYTGSGDNARAVAWQTIKAVTGGPQVCTQPFSVPANTNLTVTEGTNSWSSVANVAVSPGDPDNSFSWTSGSSATVNVPFGNSTGSNVTTVQYTNDPVYGIVEVCKAPAANSSALAGTYNFNLTSNESGIAVFDARTGVYDLPWTTTTSATISSAGLGCGGPTTVPAGGLNTAEQGTALYVTGIGAVYATGGNALVSPAPNLSLGTANVNVQAGDTTDQTIVTYTDAISTVKLCKAWTTNWDRAASKDPGPGDVVPVHGRINRSSWSDCGHWLVQPRSLHVRDPGLCPRRHHGDHHRGSRVGDEGRLDHREPGHRAWFTQPPEPHRAGRGGPGGDRRHVHRRVG